MTVDAGAIEVATEEIEGAESVQSVEENEQDTGLKHVLLLTLITNTKSITIFKILIFNECNLLD